jgi:hypothetical protein
MKKQRILLSILILTSICLNGQINNISTSQKSERVQLYALYEVSIHDFQDGFLGDELENTTYLYFLNQRLRYSDKRFIVYNTQKRTKLYFLDSREIRERQSYSNFSGNWQLDRVEMYQYNSENNEISYKDSVYSTIPDPGYDGNYWHMANLILTHYKPDNETILRNEKFIYGDYHNQIFLDANDYVYDGEQLKSINRAYVDIQDYESDTMYKSRYLYEYEENESYETFQGFENNQWKNISKQYRHYDAYDRLDTYFYYSFNDSTQQFDLSAKTYYSYNDVGNLISQKTLYGYSSDELVCYHDTMVYNENEQLIMQRSVVHTDSVLNEWEEDNYEYDTEDRLVYYSKALKDQNGDEYIDEEHHYYYDNLGNPNLETRLKYDSDLDELVFNFKRERFYTDTVIYNDLVLPHTLDNAEEIFIHKLDSVYKYHFENNEWVKYQKIGYIYQLKYFDDLSDIAKDDFEAISIYPNPAKTYIRIKCKDTDFPLILSIYNLNGKLVQSNLINKGDVVSISNLPAGVYLCKLSSKSKIISKEKLIIID